MLSWLVSVSIFSLLVVSRLTMQSLVIMCEGWIMRVEGDDTRARCRFCRILLRAHSADLQTHAHTPKHARNVSFGQPCAKKLTLRNSSKTKNSDLASNSRKKSGLRHFQLINVYIKKWEWPLWFG